MTRRQKRRDFRRWCGKKKNAFMTSSRMRATFLKFYSHRQTFGAQPWEQSIKRSWCMYKNKPKTRATWSCFWRCLPPFQVANTQNNIVVVVDELELNIMLFLTFICALLLYMLYFFVYSCYSFYFYCFWIEELLHNDNKTSSSFKSMNINYLRSRFCRIKYN